MAKKTTSIPVKHFDAKFDTGIILEKIFLDDLLHKDKPTFDGYEESGETHRHDRHSFFLLESGTVSMEVDFKKYKIKAPSIIYVHPDQVHRTLDYKNVTVSNLSINNENLNPEYLKLLGEITPAKPLSLKEDAYLIISEALSLCVKFSNRKKDKLYHSLLKDSSNALVALIISQYSERSKPVEKFSRFEIATKSFREILERNFTAMKSPTAFAEKINISTAYLNECVKNTTGYSVSYHIQQRIVLEAKRLLYHSDKSIKEIAIELGYEDAAYFSRIFTKVAGMSPLAFRNKNHE